MAGQSAKKAQRAGSELSARLNQSIVAVNAVYLLYRVLWHFGTFSTWHATGYAFILTATYACYTMAVASALEGTNNEYAMDVLIVTLIVQVGTLLSDYFWYLYLVVPGYVLYFVGGKAIKYFFPPGSSETSSVEPAVSKRMQKLEKRGVRQRAL
ncbi:hypothetical protein H310_07650 [Aphanomyces invadans]|uniref:Transmembrane protein n=1 Tax=Aphanomyces invadans TaxID=157072 RepID=A0A024U1X7_9STRA|nr:hypothetical protein H310_07650 [Aphanomyces invadans]ETW00264.1 hypothetical protein H310_07650 [Aphanomyces invadans]|eukprot:XP_008871289.1 hypothetical protein H310_07650 [Aphanomyces invadans]